MKNENHINNALTVDVEDYFHVSAFSKYIDINKWDNIKTRVENNTARLLELFAKHEIKATFFVLGWVANKYPKLIKRISEEEHEIACHGYSHQLVYEQEPEIFRSETIRSKNILEDLIQKPVIGYRAASYSIINESLWALDILAELGFKYDSSIFPIRHDRYGLPDAPKYPYRLKTPAGFNIVEFPLSTVKLFGYTLPIAGGGYFRLFPYFVSERGLKSINKNNKPFIFYLHPWEIDPGQPRISANFISRIRHYTNLDKCEMRLTKLIETFNFTTANNVLTEIGMLK